MPRQTDDVPSLNVLIAVSLDGAQADATGQRTREPRRATGSRSLTAGALSQWRRLLPIVQWSRPRARPLPDALLDTRSFPCRGPFGGVRPEKPFEEEIVEPVGFDEERVVPLRFVEHREFAIPE